MHTGSPTSPALTKSTAFADAPATHTIAPHVSRREALRTIGLSAGLLGLGLFGAKTRAFAADAGRGVGKGGGAGERSGASGSKVDSVVGGEDGGEGAGEGEKYPFALPPLGFAFDALEPHIDARTMEIHYTKHHQAYVTNANKALESAPALQGLPPGALLRRLGADGGGGIAEPLRTTLRNNVGGHANHTFFWRVIAPPSGGAIARPGPPAEFLAAVNSAFGSLDSFKTQFADAAMKRFGSGWAWLVVQGSTGRLAITTSANQDSPLLTTDVPVLGVDLWEHAYYLKYQNRRADYIEAFWNVVNWPQVAKNHAMAANVSRNTTVA